MVELDQATNLEVSFDGVKNGLLDIVHGFALKEWDPFSTPVEMKDKISEFLKDYQGYGNLYEYYLVRMPVQDPTTKRISVDIVITPCQTPRNININIWADKSDRACENL